MSHSHSRREDNALEVRFENRKLVGWFTHLDGATCSSRFVEVTEAAASSFLEEGALIEEAIECRSIPIKRMGFTLDTHLHKTDPERFQRQVIENTPPYAETYLSPDREATDYRWRAAVVTMDEFEFIFDLPEFEPFDTTPCDREVLHSGGYVTGMDFGRSSWGTMMGGAGGSGGSASVGGGVSTFVAGSSATGARGGAGGVAISASGPAATSSKAIERAMAEVMRAKIDKSLLGALTGISAAAAGGAIAATGVATQVQKLAKSIRAMESVKPPSHYEDAGRYLMTPSPKPVLPTEETLRTGRPVWSDVGIRPIHKFLKFEPGV